MKINKYGYKEKEHEGEHSELLHRQKAYEYIYLRNPQDYEFDFSKYEVHHIDKDKLNNRVNNLFICLPKEHDLIHEEQKKKGKKFKSTAELNRFLKPHREKWELKELTDDVRFWEKRDTFWEKTNRQREQEGLPQITGDYENRTSYYRRNYGNDNFFNLSVWEIIKIIFWIGLIGYFVWSFINLFLY